MDSFYQEPYTPPANHTCSALLSCETCGDSICEECLGGRCEILDGPITYTCYKCVRRCVLCEWPYGIVYCDKCNAYYCRIMYCGGVVLELTRECVELHNKIHKIRELQLPPAVLDIICSLLGPSKN